MPADPTWRVEVVVPRHAGPVLAEALEPLCAVVSWFADEGEARVHGHCLACPDDAALDSVLVAVAAALGIAVPEAHVALVTPRDWITETVRQFPPITVGRYFVHSAHFADQVPAGRVALQVGAGAAFGSGEHASTAGCLLALDRLARRRRVVRGLDMGCGSGILALAVARTWRAPVVACDIDPEAVRVSRRNARRNGVASVVRAVVGDGYATPAVRRGTPYDLVVSNILARPLARMAPALARVLAAGGVAVLAGFLARDSAPVEIAHRRAGLRLEARLTIDDWCTVVMRK
jgi:ribosomal protein L11 methyltransferase